MSPDLGWQTPALHDRLPDSAYVHGTGALELVPTLDPDDAWQRLTRSARRELRTLTGGRKIDWVAGQVDQSGDGRVWAAVLGPTGLHIASPGSDTQTWTFASWRFRPGSLTSGTHKITTDSAQPPEADRPDGEEPLLAQALDSEFRGFLGRLPTPLQVRIQEPFRRGHDLTTFQWYLGDIDQADETWRFWCYLTDSTTMVFASGSRQPTRAGLAWTARSHQATLA
jgi:hypothetical protein